MARRPASSFTLAAAVVLATLCGALVAPTARAAIPSPTAYTVQPGDTLASLARTEHVHGGWPALASANHLGSPYLIHPGDHLVFPADSTHAAQSATVPFPVPVTGGAARQVITVQAHDTYATVIAWQKSGRAWTAKFATGDARIGAHGLTDGATRKQGTGTTPTGTYTLTQAFGVGADPGSRMPYHQVTSDDWWVEDASSPYYNQLRAAAQGGFPLTESGDHGSEHLVNYPVQYHNALVIDFNTHPAVPGRGAGIFLHDLGPQHGPTAGCVAVPASMLTDILRWIDPAQHPVIAIA